MKMILAVLASILVVSSAQSIRKEKVLCLHAHNVLRALHPGTGSMVWDDELASGAEKWASKLAREKKLINSRGPYGENLYMSGSASVNCANAVLSWYKGIKDYDYNKPGFSYAAGAFTQVVWKGSTKLGVGIAVKGSILAVVARYLPPGNMQGEANFRANVLPQKPGAKVPSASDIKNSCPEPCG